MIHVHLVTGDSWGPLTNTQGVNAIVLTTVPGGWRSEKSEVKKGSPPWNKFQGGSWGGDGIVSKLGYVLLSCLDLEINLSQPRWSQIFNNPEIEICSLKIAFIVEIYAYSRQLPSWCVCGQRLPPIQPFEFPKKKIESPNKSKTKIKAAATLVSSLKLPSPLGTKSNPIHPIGLFTYCNGLQLAFLHPQKTQKRS